MYADFESNCSGGVEILISHRVMGVVCCKAVAKRSGSTGVPRRRTRRRSVPSMNNLCQRNTRTTL